MDQSAQNKAPENLSTHSQEKIERKQEENIKNAKEVREAADLGKAAYIEAVGMDESVETTGRVSEVLSNTKEQDSSGGGAAATSKKHVITPDQIRQNLLKNLPGESLMKRQIEKEIKKEIGYLHKKAMKMLRSPGKISYFEMTNLMKKIRELKGILITLIKASLENLKTLWLRYVHGVM